MLVLRRMIEVRVMMVVRMIAASQSLLDKGDLEMCLS